MAPDPKMPRRYRATLAEWEWFRTWFANDRCWVCNEAWTELHHILPRSHSGDDDIVNLAPLCAECHRRIEARDPIARSLIRQALMPSSVDYLSRKLGGDEPAREWLKRHYPMTRVAA